MDEFDPYWQVWLRQRHDLVNPAGSDWADEFDTAGMINDLWNVRGRLADCLAPLPRAAALVAKVNEIIDTTLAC
ncbi:MAG: hypothetical protein AMXMBFR13_35220 [Phycisphaerae bacterium]